MTGFEPAASCSQTRRDTNFAIPGYSLFCHDTTASGKNKVFSVCGHSCGQSRFCAAFGNRDKSRKRRCHKAFRRFALLYPGYRHGTPKASTLPTALIPDIQFLPLYHGGGENQRLFCLWSPAVKPACVSRKTISILLKSGAKSRPCAQKKFCTCRTIYLGQ